MPLLLAYAVAVAAYAVAVAGYQNAAAAIVASNDTAVAVVLRSNDLSGFGVFGGLGVEVVSCRPTPIVVVKQGSVEST